MCLVKLHLQKELCLQLQSCELALHMLNNQVFTYFFMNESGGEGANPNAANVSNIMISVSA